MIQWIPLSSETQLEDIIRASAKTPQLIFKHSTRCSVSSMALNRIEKSGVTPAIPFYFLDLIKYRSISNSIENRFDVTHQSPQVLIIENGLCTYNESHNGIRLQEIAATVEG